MVVRNDFNTLPVDKGWAWVIAAAGFLTHAVMGGAIMTNALMFVEILEMYKASITTGSLVFMFISFTFSISSVLVTHYVMPKLKERRCLLLGGLICFLSSLGLSFAPTIGAFIAITTVKAGFLTHAVMGGAIMTNALMFVEILEMYKASITTGSLVFMFISFTFSISSVLVTHYVMPKLKERRCLLLGGLICFLSSLGLSFAPTIGAFIAITTVKAISSGLIFVPALSLIPHYFKRYRSRASIIPFCGMSTAQIIGPFIIRAVRKEFGVRGTYFLQSAFELHVCLAGLLLRPVSAYRFLPEDENSPGNDTVAAAAAAKIPVAANSDTNNHDVLGDAAANESNTKLLQVTSEGLTGDAEAAESLLGQDEGDEDLRETTVANIDEQTDGTRAIENSDKSNVLLGSTTKLGRSFEHMKEDVTEKPADKTLTRLQTFYQASSLNLWTFRWTLLAVVPGSCVGYLVHYLPTINKFQGASLDQVAYLSTIMGCAELVSRISVGFIADTKVLRPSQIYVISQTCLGIACHLHRFATSFETLIPMVFVIGLFFGTRGAIQSLMCVEVVGAQKMAKAFSLLLMVMAMVGSLFNPTLGAVIEATESFVPALHILGICFMVCASMLACLPLFTRLDAKHDRKK